MPMKKEVFADSHQYAANTDRKRRAAHYEQPVQALEQLVTIRDIGFREIVHRTGHAMLFQCAKVQERVNDSTTTWQQFQPAFGRPSEALQPLLHPVLFHEIISESGDWFACPQEIAKNCSEPGEIQAFKASLLSHSPVYRWMILDLSDDCKGYEYREIGPVDDEHIADYNAFADQLAATLTPYQFDRPDNPTYQHLFLREDVEDESAPSKYNEQVPYLSGLPPDSPKSDGLEDLEFGLL